MVRIDSGRNISNRILNVEFVGQIVLTFIPLWFAFILMLQGHTFDTSKTYAMMAIVMSEENWALYSGGMVFVVMACWFSDNYYALLFQNCLLMAWHGLVALCVFLANPLTTGTGTYGILALACTLRAIALVRQHKRVLSPDSSVSARGYSSSADPNP